MTLPLAADPDDQPEPGRLAVLDLVRGVALLGILAINLAGYAGPIASTLSPDLPEVGSLADATWYVALLVVFEGKMRALFTLLFGASLLLFIDRAEARGENGEQLQFRRLGWLALFGYLHFLLFWWGDILFTYALAGFAALAFRQARPAALIAAGLAMFGAWHISMAVADWPQIAREKRVLAGRASPPEAAEYRQEQRDNAALTSRELAGYRAGFAAQVVQRLRDQPDEPLQAALATIGESLPLMLIGMGLFRSGLYGGRWPRRRLLWLAAGGIAAGGVPTLLFAGWVWLHRFPPVLMLQGLAYLLALPHLLMGLGYLAALVAVAPALLRTAVGQRMVAAGQMAFSNYLGTTVVMTALFYGWGLGLVGRVPEHWLWPFLLGGWALTLGWSKPWLARFRHGPLEWLWRSLTLWQFGPLRR